MFSDVIDLHFLLRVVDLPELVELFYDELDLLFGEFVSDVLLEGLESGGLLPACLL